MGQSKHDKIASGLAKKKNVEYNKGQGPDIKTPRQVIEVAVSDSDLKDSKRQLQGFKKPRYIATESDKIAKALEVTENTSIGVMGPTGHIHKRAGGGKKKK